MDEQSAGQPSGFPHSSPTVPSNWTTAEPNEPVPFFDARSKAESISDSNNRPHDSVPLDVQYIDLLTRLRSLLTESNWSPPAEASQQSEIIISLQDTLVDLQVWGYDLSGEHASLFEHLGNLSGHNDKFTTHLRHIFSGIDRLLLSIEGEARIDSDARSRPVIIAPMILYSADVYQIQGW